MGAGAPCGRGCFRARRCRACRRRALRRRLRRSGRTGPRHIEGLAAMAFDDRASRVVAREHSQGISCRLGGGSVAACCPAAVDPNLRARRKPAPSTHLLRGGVLSRAARGIPPLPTQLNCAPPPPRPDRREKGADRLGAHASGGARVAAWAVCPLHGVQLRSGVCAAEHGQKSRPSDANATRGHAPACTRLQSAPYAVVALAVHGYECCILCQIVVAGECGAWRGVHNAYVGYRYDGHVAVARRLGSK